MTCCLLLTFFVGGVADRSGRLGRRSDEPAPTVRARLSVLLAARLGTGWRQWLAVIALAEIGLAWLLVQVLVSLDHGAGSGSRVMLMVGAVRRRSGAAAALSLVPLAAVSGAGAFVLTARLAAPTGLTAQARGIAAKASPVQAWWASARACTYCGLAGYAVAVLPTVRDLAASSHLVLMAQTMLLLVVGPALLATALAEGPAPGWVRSARTRLGGGLAPIAVAGYLAALFGWHLPRLHAAAMSNPGLDCLRIATTVAAGLLLWGFLFSSRRSAASRLAVLLAVGAGSGLLGLAFLVSDRTVLAIATTANNLGLSALTDQRLAGLVMMVIDLAVLLPVAGSLLPGGPARLRADRVAMAAAA